MQCVYGLKHPEARMFCIKQLAVMSESGGQAMMVLIIVQIYKKTDAAGVRRQRPEGASETAPHTAFLIFTLTLISRA